MSRIKLKLLISLLCGLFGIMLINHFMRSESSRIRKALSPVDIIVASRSMKKGEKLCSENLSKLPMPLGYLNDNLIKASDWNMIEGHKVLDDIKRGEFITRSLIDFDDKKIKVRKGPEIISSRF